MCQYDLHAESRTGIRELSGVIKMKRISAVAVVAVVAIGQICFSQMSPDQALEKLKERQAAATQPENIQATIDAYQEKILQLEVEINKLQAENDALKDQINALKKTGPSPGEPGTNQSDSGPAGKIQPANLYKGMSRDEVIAQLGQPDRDTISGDGTEQMYWNLPGGADYFDRASGAGCKEHVSVTVVGGKVVDFADEKDRL